MAQAEVKDEKTYCPKCGKVVPVRIIGGPQNKPHLTQVLVCRTKDHVIAERLTAADPWETAA